MGEFNKRHLDLITYSSICHAKTVLDLYIGYINKNIRITYVPFCYLKSLKIKQKQNDIVKLMTNLKVSLLVKTCHLHYNIKRCEKHFYVIRLPNIKYKMKIIIIKEKYLGIK